ncbi:MAG: hypothetical protein ACLQVG_14030, partial [Terriglobia bacterium]
ADRSALFRRLVAQGPLSGLAVLSACAGESGAAADNLEYLVFGGVSARAPGKAAGPDSGPCATCPLDFRGLSAVRGRLATPWFRTHPAERRVGQLVPAQSGALPLHLEIAFTRSSGA